MSMMQAPTLVLGIGGIGCRIAAAISDELTDQDRMNVAVVGLDTNLYDLRKLADHNMKAIRISDDHTAVGVSDTALAELIRVIDRLTAYMEIRRDLTVTVVGSITGRTGSGLFIRLPLYI